MLLHLYIKALLRSDQTSQDCQRGQDQKQDVYVSKWRAQRLKNRLLPLSVLEGRILAKACRANTSLASLSKMQRMPHFSKKYLKVNEVY